MDYKKKIADLPDLCGVYLMKTADKEIIYVGKAVSVRKRLRSHFRKIKNEPGSWLTRVEAVDYMLCDTEEQALLLEASLIKEHRPRYNIALRDDKSFPYVLFSDEDFPRITVSRLKGKISGKVCGPFVNVALLKSVLKMVRKLFPFRSCRIMPEKPCLYFHLKMCSAPCAGGETKKEYRERIDNIYKIFSGDRKKLLAKLQRRMRKKAAEHCYEEAAHLRDTLRSVRALYTGKKEDSEFLVLKDVLKLKRVPLTIEAMDISNISGTSATGSIVTFCNGLPDKNNYRRFRIKAVAGIDDYKMIAEVTRRRYGRLKEEKRPLPDLVLIDGGYGHVRTAKRELVKLGLNLAVVGIAKQNEELWFPDRKKPLVLDKESPALHLIQRIRDEAHRFARKYHVLLRKKKMLGEPLSAASKKAKVKRKK